MSIQSKIKANTNLWVLLFLVGICNVCLASYGGIWVVTSNVGLSTTMEAIYQTSPRDGYGGSIVLSRNYYTILDSIPTNSSIYTRGVGLHFNYNSDTLVVDNSDTTALHLDAFVGQTVQVNAFFVGSSAETLFVTVEQALSYDPIASDSARAHTSIYYYNRGFWTTDTLFTTNDSLYIAAETDPGDTLRWYRDSFTITKPYIRLKLHNMKIDSLKSPTHFEFYVRQKDAYMTGASARQQDRQTFSTTPRRIQ